MRKGKATPRIIAPDPKYNDVSVAKFINTLTKEGKKNLASNIFYNALAIIEEKTGKPGLETFKLALENASPTIEPVRKRVGGVIRQVPVEVRPLRKHYLSRKWIVEGAKKTRGKNMKEKLANELMATAQGEGNAIKSKNNNQKMAEANKAYAAFS